MTPTARAFVRAATLLATSLLLASPAGAHGNANLGDLYQGMLQPLFHPEFLLAALAIALWSTQQEGRTAVAICTGFMGGVLVGSAGALLGLGGGEMPWIPCLIMLVVGPLVAASVRVPAAAGATLGVVAGLAQGHAGTAAEVAQIGRPALWTLGLGIGAGLLGTYANAAVQRVPAFWMQVAVRVLGSWITAIGLLVGVTAVRAR